MLRRWYGSAKRDTWADDACFEGVVEQVILDRVIARLLVIAERGKTVQERNRLAYAPSAIVEWDRDDLSSPK